MPKSVQNQFDETTHPRKFERILQKLLKESKFKQFPRVIETLILSFCSHACIFSLKHKHHLIIVDETFTSVSTVVGDLNRQNWYPIRLQTPIPKGKISKFSFIFDFKAVCV